MPLDPPPPLAYATPTPDTARGRFFTVAAWLLLVHSLWWGVLYGRRALDLAGIVSHDHPLRSQLLPLQLAALYEVLLALVCLLILRRRPSAGKWLIAIQILPIALVALSAARFYREDWTFLPMAWGRLRAEQLFDHILGAWHPLVVAAAFILIARTRLFREHVGAA